MSGSVAPFVMAVMATVSPAGVPSPPTTPIIVQAHIDAVALGALVAGGQVDLEDIDAIDHRGPATATPLELIQALMAAAVAVASCAAVMPAVTATWTSLAGDVQRQRTRGSGRAGEGQILPVAATPPPASAIGSTYSAPLGSAGRYFSTIAVASEPSAEQRDRLGHAGHQTGAAGCTVMVLATIREFCCSCHPHCRRHLEIGERHLDVGGDGLEANGLRHVVLL
jgi:hypothetical protein